MKKFFKKLVAVMLTVAMVATMVACSGNESESVKDDSGVKTYKIGLCNYVDDASLNQICDNIKSQLAKIEQEKNVKFEIDYQNCNADSNVLTQICSNYVGNGVDLMIGVATPVAMSMQAATEENKIPVVFSAVSDPISTNLVDSFEKPGSNITGTSDMLNTEAITKLMLAAYPDMKKVGLLYDLGQDASTKAIADAKAIFEAKGIEVIERTGTNVDEIVLAAEALANDGVQAVFTPSDNTVMQAELSIYETLANAGVAHFAGADSFALNGAFCGYGVNYAILGQETANVAADILLNGKNPADVPVVTFDNGIAVINEEAIAKLGLDFETIKKAFEPFCSSVTTIKTAESF